MKTLISIVAVISACFFCSNKLSNNKLVFLSPLIKNIDKNTDTFDCQKWTLTQQDVIYMITKMEKVESEEQYALCYTLPCSYSATVKYKGEQYEMIVNAGSYITLFNSKIQLYFIFKDNTKYFLMPCDCCEEE
jgi:hypothetical protein